jgi:hypothetical protein
MDATNSIRPPITYYWFAAPFLILGISLLVYSLLHGITHITDNLTQVVVPGVTELNLKRGLTYTVFLEQESVVNGKVYLTPGPVSGLTCKVKSSANGNDIDVWRARSSVTYNLGGRSGKSVFGFFVPETGEYSFACDYGSGSSGPEVVVAVGTGVGEKIVKMVLTSLTAVLGGAVIAGWIFLVVFVLRERALKQNSPPIQPAA